jgi:hypothetical protein
MGFFPGYVHDAAQRLHDEGLQSEVVERQYAADEPPILRLLETLPEAGERQALARLARLLRNFPLMLAHPYVWGIIRNLHSGVWLSAEANQASLEWLIELVKGWAEGITCGYQVSITSPGRGRGGQTPQLFPHLDDREGWLPTEEAAKESRDAIQFRRAYDDLMKHLQPCLAWRTLPRDYRERTKRQLSTTLLIREQAEKIRQAFEQFKQDWKIVHKPLAQEALQKIVQAGLEVRKGGNPRHTVACELLVQLHARRCPILGRCWHGLSHHLRNRLRGPVERMGDVVPFGDELQELRRQVGL